MSNDQIQPEDDYYARRRARRDVITGRAWVKRDLEFWHRCTIEYDHGDRVTVSLDNMDELTVDRIDVQQWELEREDLVFVQHWGECISGNPAFIRWVKGETVNVEYPSELFERTERRLRPESRTCLLREVLVYREPPQVDWQKGTRVFAYKTILFTPSLYLLFPAIVRRVHFDVCVEVEFGDGETSYVPTTLVEMPALAVGDIVHTCTSYVSHGINPDERWGPCRIVNRDANNLILRDGTGDQFELPISMIAVLPKGYRMIDGKFERVSNESAGESVRPESQSVTAYDVHIVRTESWLNALDDPITKSLVDRVIDADPELTWSSGHPIKKRDDAGRLQEYVAILWKGQTCFWWNRIEIMCARPNEKQLAKMIDIAIELDANVIGGDGKEYH